MPSVELVNIHKTFGELRALDGVALRVNPGSVQALLGENGAGKTTLMRIAFGMTTPDAGSVVVDGIPQRFRSPADAIGAGIGMVHQHFALVPSMTVAENVSLGRSGIYHRAQSARTVLRMCEETGLQLDPEARVETLSIGGQQRVEILKAVARNARVLVLDEPTAVLPPSEAKSLLQWIRQFATGDRSVVLITHKVRDAISIADEITVLRHGRVVLSSSRASTSEDALARAMVDRQSELAPRHALAAKGATIVTLENATAVARGRHVLNGASLEVRSGELIGVAGVEGSGYQELLRIIAGKLVPSSGTRTGPHVVGFIPEDRHREALALDMSAVENVALATISSGNLVLNWKSLRSRTHALAAEFDVRGPVGDAPVRQLSGGNQQKLVLARELAEQPALVVAESPTRGLDLQASSAVLTRLGAARDRGAAVVVYSRDVDELLSVADRVLVVHAGRVAEVSRDMESITRALVGLAA